jgi:hypothetical protein
MQMNVRSLFFFVLLLVCIQNLSAQNCLIKEYIVTDNERSDTTRYVYDNKTHLLTELTYPMHDGDYLTEKRNYYDGQLISLTEGGYSHDYIYNDKKQLEKIIDYDDLRMSNFYQEFVFDNQNRLLKHTYYESYEGNYMVSAFDTYSYKGDSIMIMEEFHDYHDDMKTPQYTYVYEYGDKAEPLFQPIAFPDGIQKYLVKKVVCTKYDNTFVDEYSYTRTCTYNTQGYPIECMVKYIDGTEKQLEQCTYYCK